MDHNCVFGRWDPPLGARVRIGFCTNNNRLHVLLWIEVSKDGSIYLGPRKPDSRLQKLGAKSIEGRQTFIGYDEGEPIQDEASLKNPKLSFHSSGAVHISGKRWWRESLRGLSERQLLCQILFQHPSEFACLRKLRKHDIGLFYPIDDEYPILSQIYVFPLSIQHAPVRMRGAKYQWSVVLAYKGLHGVSDVAVQVVLYHAEKGTWPPSTYIVWRAVPDDNKRQNLL